MQSQPSSTTLRSEGNEKLSSKYQTPYSPTLEPIKNDNEDMMDEEDLESMDDDAMYDNDIIQDNKTTGGQ